MSTKGMAIVAIAVISLAALAYHFGRTKGKLAFAVPGFKHANAHAYQALAMASHAFDTDPQQVKTKIITLMADNTTDHNQFQHNIDRVTHDVDTDLAPGGRLNNLIQERRDGRSSAVDFDNKLHEYVRQVGNDHDVHLQSSLFSRFGDIGDMVGHGFGGHDDRSGHTFGLIDWDHDTSHPHPPRGHEDDDNWWRSRYGSNWQHDHDDYRRRFPHGHEDEDNRREGDDGRGGFIGGLLGGIFGQSRGHGHGKHHHRREDDDTFNRIKLLIMMFRGGLRDIPDNDREIIRRWSDYDDKFAVDPDIQWLLYGAGNRPFGGGPGLGVISRGLPYGNAYRYRPTQNVMQQRYEQFNNPWAPYSGSDNPYNNRFTSPYDIQSHYYFG